MARILQYEIDCSNIWISPYEILAIPVDSELLIQNTGYSNIIVNYQDNPSPYDQIGFVLRPLETIKISSPFLSIKGQQGNASKFYIEYLPQA